MKKNDFLFIIPFGLSSTWLADYEKRTAIEIAYKYPVIEFFLSEGINFFKFLLKPKRMFSLLSHNHYVFVPIYIIPFQRIPIIKEANFYIAVLELRLIIFLHKEFRTKQQVFWSFTLQYSVFPKQFGKKILAIYDCIDDFVSEDRFINQQWKDIETTFIKQSHIIFCNTETLYQLKKKLHPRVYLVPSGFDLRSFSESLKKEEPKDIKFIKLPIVGFVGNINNRLDFSLIQTLVKKMPEISFVFIGREDPLFLGIPGTDFQRQWSTIKQNKNVYFLGEKKRTELKNYITNFTIGAIFYDISQQFNLHCFPLKLLEYFYVGVPVISTNIKAVVRYKPYVTIIKTPDDTVHIINTINNKNWSSSNRNNQRIIAIQNSWEQKVSSMLKIITTFSP